MLISTKHCKNIFFSLFAKIVSIKITKRFRLEEICKQLFGFLIVKEYSTIVYPNHVIWWFC